MSLLSFLRRETAYTLKVFFSPILGAEMAVAKARREREQSRNSAAIFAQTATGDCNVVEFPAPIKKASSSSGLTVQSTIGRASGVA